MESKPLSREEFLADIAKELIGDTKNTLLIGGDSSLSAHYPDADAWHTTHRANHGASTLPQGSHSYDTVIIRLPKSHTLFDFLLRVLFYYIHENTAVYVYGHNDEGIKSAKKKCLQFFDTCPTHDYKKHCRILIARATKELLDKHTSKILSLDSFAYRAPLTTSEGTSYDTLYYPGMFAHGTLDTGTKLLLTHMPPLDEDSRILDYACGSGIIARDLSSASPISTWDLLDVDTLSLAAARINCHDLPVENYILSDRLPENKKYHHIVSNPPMHTEKEEHTRIIEHLITEAPQHLYAGGSLTIVTQSRLPLDNLFAQSFRIHMQLAQTPQFTVWHGVL